MGEATGVDTAMMRIAEMVGAVKDPGLRMICQEVLYDKRLMTGWGSSGRHHAYPGGLAVHTAEVMRYARGMARDLGADLDVVTAAALWHDYCKIYEYEPDGEGGVVKTPYRKLIRHVAGSYDAFMRTAEETEYWDDTDTLEEIAHCILAHHGRREWGSPMEPQTVEAHILHYADMLSSRFGPGAKRGEG